jgi:hypothetical protein
MSALKYWGQVIFSNMHNGLSAPPDKPNYAQWDVPEVLKDDVRFAHQAIFGKKAEGIKADTFRICW